LVIGNAGLLKVIDGSFSLRAHNLTVNGPSAAILAVQGSQHESGAISIDLTGSLSLAGKVRANAATDSGGDISIHADGDITILESGDDGVESDGTAAGVSGGSIHLDAGGYVLIQDPVHAAGADSGADAAGGLVEIRAGGDIVANSDGHIAAPGRSGGGGTVELVAGGSIVLDEHIDVSGRGNDADAGDIQLEAAGGISMSLPSTAHGGVGAGGGAAAGGSISLEAGCGGGSVQGGAVLVGASMDLTSGETGGGGAAGGTFRVEASGPVTIGDGVLIDSHPLSGAGSGGAISIRSAAAVTISSGARLDTRGGAAVPTGAGANITLDGCTVQVQPSATLNTSGMSGGGISLIAQKLAPESGTQPLFVSSTASLVVNGTTAARNGSISLATFSDGPGECTNEPTKECWANEDCTVGCQQGNCVGANPNTEGTTTQFSVAVTRGHVNGSGSCASACQ